METPWHRHETTDGAAVEHAHSEGDAAHTHSEQGQESYTQYKGVLGAPTDGEAAGNTEAAGDGDGDGE